MVSKAINWTAGTVASIIGGLVALVLVVTLVTGSPQKGANAGWAVAHWGLVAFSTVISWADNVGPALDEGEKYGDRAAKTTAGGKTQS
jgi:hypothetical protein